MKRCLPVSSLALCTSFFLISCKKNDNLARKAFNDKSILNGYFGEQSYSPGANARLYISSDTAYEASTLNVYDVNGALAFKIPFKKIHHQVPQGETPYESGFAYTDPLSFKVPEVKSGVYLIANKIPIIIKAMDEKVDFTVVYPLNTENAYCQSGGRSLYTTPVAKKVSFLRPISYTSYGDGFLKWVNKQQYSYNVIADSDLDDFSNLKGKILIIIGHSEYWSRKGRRNFDRFVNGGRDALILSGNTMWWQVRYSDDRHQLICYKGKDEPPIVDSLRTIEWGKAVLRYTITQSIGCDFDRGGYGVGVKNDGWAGFKIVNPRSPLLAGLDMKKGDIISCPSTEYDGAPLKGLDPDGTPQINNNDLKFHKVELIGYDFGARNNIKTVPTAIIFRKTASSGLVIDFPTTDWCTVASFGKPPIVAITKNAINGLLARQNLFAD